MNRYVAKDIKELSGPPTKIVWILSECSRYGYVTHWCGSSKEAAIDRFYEKQHEDYAPEVNCEGARKEFLKIIDFFRKESTEERNRFFTSWSSFFELHKVTYT